MSNSPFLCGFPRKHGSAQPKPSALGNSPANEDWLLSVKSGLSFLFHCIPFELESKGENMCSSPGWILSLRLAADNSGFLMLTWGSTWHLLQRMDETHLRTQSASIICASPFAVCILPLILDLRLSIHLLYLHVSPWQLHQKIRAREQGIQGVIVLTQVTEMWEYKCWVCQEWNSVLSLKKNIVWKLSYQL